MLVIIMMTYLLCQYNNILGVPKTGFHSHRLFGFAQNDILGTILIAVMIAYFFKTNFIYTLIILFIIATVLHLVFCVNTTFVNDVLRIRF